MIDFYLTQWFRVVMNDLTIFHDTVTCYLKVRRSKANLVEFGKVILFLLDEEAKLLENDESNNDTNNNEQDLLLIIGDYFQDVVLKHILDDISQYPFFIAKSMATLHTYSFGTPVIKVFLDILNEKTSHYEFDSLFKGIIPYLIAAGIFNYEYLAKETYHFLHSMMSHMPDSSSQEKSAFSEIQDSALTMSRTNSVSSELPTIHKSPQYDFQNPTSPKVTRKKTTEKETYFSYHMHKLWIILLTHPFLVLSLNLATQESFKDHNWISGLLQISSTVGLVSLFRGCRARILVSLLPISPVLFLGVPDLLIHRIMFRQGFIDRTGGLISMAGEVIDEGRNLTLSEGKEAENSSFGIKCLFNYGLLTLTHGIPSFVSFIMMRSISWLVLGPSLRRQKQTLRRKYIVEQYVKQLDNKKRGRR